VLGYRLFVEVGGDRRQVEKLAYEQLHSWMRRKKWNADALEPGEAVTLAEGVRGQLLELSQQDGSRSVRARMVEGEGERKWVTQFTVHVPAQEKRKPWLWLDVESPGQRYVQAPNLAGMLLNVFDGQDGGTRLGPGPGKVGAADVRAVVDSVCDPKRRGLVFVAGSDEKLPNGSWADYVQRLLRDTVGLSGAHVLDPSATEAFNNAIGPAHSVAPWTVRTFRPGVEPDDLVDAERHRVLGLERISSDSHYNIARMLGRRAREANLETPLPSLATKIDRAFEQQIDDRLVAPLASPVPEQRVPPTWPVGAITETPPATAPPFPLFVSEELAEAIGVLRQALGAEFTAERIRDLARFDLMESQRRDSQAAIAIRLRENEARVDLLTTDRNELRRQLEDSQLEQLIADEEIVKANTTVKHLRMLLSESGRAEEAWSEPESVEVEFRPQDYENLLDVLDQFGNIRFTGEPKYVRELDEYDRSGVWAGKIWDVFAVLHDYATAMGAGACSSDVDGYLRKTPDGYRSYSYQRHAQNESEDVRKNRTYRTARVLPVPVEVDAAGAVFMGAHFKIAQSGMISPRLHYFDDTRGSGKVYVGYIGRHLPTKKTN